MKITKTIVKTYDIIIFPFTPNMTVGEFIKRRKFLKSSFEPFEDCFVCDRKFNDNEVPYMVQIKGEENRFACADCKAKFEECEKIN